jgi:hypothetical protein
MTTLYGYLKGMNNEKEHVEILYTLEQPLITVKIESKSSLYEISYRINLSNYFPLFL